MYRVLVAGLALTISGAALAAPANAERNARAYVARIARLSHSGPRLNAVLVVNPDWRKRAAALDAEARSGKVRGPVHGRAVLIKDNIETADRMATTAGSLALAIMSRGAMRGWLRGCGPMVH